VVIHLYSRRWLLLGRSFRRSAGRAKRVGRPVGASPRASQAGDHDMAPAELQATVERAETKRRQLVAEFQEGAEVDRILATVPRAAELCEARIARP
jgi:hypothetical protein